MNLSSTLRPGLNGSPLRMYPVAVPFERGSDRRIVIEPPPEWGSYWAWNITEDGLGVYFRRT